MFHSQTKTLATLLKGFHKTFASFRFSHTVKLAFPRHVHACNEAPTTGLQHGCKATQNLGTPCLAIITVKRCTPCMQSGKAVGNYLSAMCGSSVPSKQPSAMLFTKAPSTKNILAANQHLCAIVPQTYPRQSSIKWLVKYLQSVIFVFSTHTFFRDISWTHTIRETAVVPHSFHSEYIVFLLPLSQPMICQ